jgi:hypothetical protein
MKITRIKLPPCNWNPRHWLLWNQIGVGVVVVLLVANVILYLL